MGDWFTVNTTQSGNQVGPAMTTLADGSFIVVWASDDQDGSGTGIYAQRYDASGTAMGGETRINTTTDGNQGAPTIAALPDGGYVVAWTSDHADGIDIYAQRYDATGTPFGAETRVSEVTEVGQGQPSITARPDGSYLISWTSGNEGTTGQDIYGRIFWPDDGAGRVITGTEAADNLGGAAGSDTLIGRGGDDWLNGAPGDDLMQGGTGNDTYVVDDAGDVVEEAADAGIDTVQTSLATYTLPENLENLVYSGRMAFVGHGNGLDNALTGDIAADRLSGGDGNDTLMGEDGNDQLDGGAGDDMMFGGAGDDLMEGGTGNDTYKVEALGDQVVEEADAGIDTVRTSLRTYTLGDNVENLVFTGTRSFSGSGNALSNIITGGKGNDTLSGGAGDDELHGGPGGDLMEGGAGNDTYGVDALGDQVVEEADAGIDTVRTTLATFALPDNVENLVFVGTGNFTGSGNTLSNSITGGAGNDALSGGENNDTLMGEGGDDELDGGAGDDLMKGGTGNDTYGVDALGDQVVEEMDAGIDTVRTNVVIYALGDNVENLVFTGTGAFFGYGNALANSMTSGDGVDQLSGGDGNDILQGKGGSDQLYGGRSHDRLDGGNGNDTLYGGSGVDWLDGGAGDDVMVGGAGYDTYVVDSLTDQVVEKAGAGTDTVRTTLSSYTLGDNVENLVFTGTGAFSGSGNALSNIITGGMSNDTLSGGDGDDELHGGPGGDLMEGGAGNDIYGVDALGDQVVEEADAGIDTVRTTLGSYTLGDNVENLIFTGTGAFSGYGNTLSNSITSGDGNDTLLGGEGADRLFGGRGHDWLGGGDGNDTLYGGSGVDWLDGGSGDDMMVGGAGYDTYVVDSLADQVVETAGAGTDTVRTTLSAYMLGDNVENLAFVGTGDFSGSGNALSNAITGGDGHDQLEGDDGDDLLYGGAGNDTLQGGKGNDRLEGNGGADTLTGDGGHDIFVFRDVSDSSGDGIDTIADFSMAGRDRINLSIIDADSSTPTNDRFVFIGTAAFSGTAGELRYADGRLPGDVTGDGIADLTIKVTNLALDGSELLL